MDKIDDIKLEGGRYFYFDLNVTLTFMCDLDLINYLLPHNEDYHFSHMALT